MTVRMRAAQLVWMAPILVLAVANAVLVSWSLEAVMGGALAVDWVQFVEAGQRVWSGALYGSTETYGYRYSPLLAYAFTVIGLLSPLAWRALHVAAALLLPGWRLVAITLISWPFWFDVETGNTVVFTLLAAAWALRGNRVGIFAFLALAMLIPRPFMLPVLVWLLWRHREWRLPFIGMFAAHMALVLVSGWGPAWAVELLWTPSIVTSPSNIGPSRFIGLWWLAVGIPLAAWLTWKGRLGLASLAISPYLLPYYLMFAFLELVPNRVSGRATAGGADTRQSLAAS